MKRSLLALLVTASALLAGCGILGSNDKDETTGWSAQKLYGEAKDAMSSKTWDRAIKYLEKLEARYPYGRFAQQAQIDVAYSYYKNGDRAQAIAACDRFIKLYPNHDNVDYAYYLKGLVNFNETSGFLSVIDNPDMSERDSKGSRESFDAFKELVTRFPESKYAEDARARMRYLVNSLAQYEVHVARYYYSRGAYVAAINRSQSALADYRDVPALEEALFILMRSYEALGMQELRDDTKRVLEKNYPQSSYLTKEGGQPQAPWWKFW